MSAVPNQSESGLQMVQPTALPATHRGPRLGLPTPHELAALREYGEIVFKSGMVPAYIKSPEATIVVMRYGHQLGIDEFTALQNMFVVGGKPSAFASLLHSLILRDHGGDAIQIIQSTPKKAELSCKRRDSTNRTTISYTIEEAHQAGLKDGNWSKYPADMLFARAISRAGRQLFRDSTMGLYVPEELGSQVVEVNGEIVDVEPTPRHDDRPAKTNRLALLHAIGAKRGLDHDALHRIALAKFGFGLGERNLTDTMIADLGSEIERVSDEDLEDWAFDWLAALEGASDADLLAAIAQRIKDAGITQKSRPDVAEAFQAAKRRLEAEPVEAEYRNVVDKQTGEIVGTEAVTEKAKKSVPTFGENPPAPDRYTS